MLELVLDFFLRVGFVEVPIRLTDEMVPPLNSVPFKLLPIVNAPMFSGLANRVTLSELPCLNLMLIRTLAGRGELEPKIKPGSDSPAFTSRDA